MPPIDSAKAGESEAKQNADGPERIPTAVIKRLSLYTRALQILELNKVEKVSSTELGRQLGLNSSQVRKDLAHFGQFGVPGFGYHVSDLRSRLKQILGTDREVAVALIGTGHLGTALLSYGGFSRQGFRLVCGFDIRVPDPPFLGPGDAPIHPMEQLEEKIRDLGIGMVILTVPADAAQQIVDRVVAAGVSAILNFVPRRLETPPEVKVHYVDLAIEMESLSYYLK